MDHYINGRALSESIQKFPEMMERTFQRRSSLAIPFLSRAYELTASYLADGLYPAGAIESVLKETFGADRNILDCSYATATGTKIGVPVATVSRYPSYRVLTNYNGAGERDGDMGGALPDRQTRGRADRGKGRSFIKPEDGAGRVPLWEM